MASPGSNSETSLPSLQADPSHRPSRRDRLSRLGRLVRKELLEILRDRRTIITLVLMPVLLYPLLSLVFQHFAVANQALTPKESPWNIAVRAQEELQHLKLMLERGHKLVEPDVPLSDRVKFFGPDAPSKALDLEVLVRDHQVHLGVQFRNPNPRKGAVDCQLIYDDSFAGGRAALDFVERRINAANAEEATQRPAPPWRMWIVRPERTALKTEPPGSAMVSLEGIVPLILILMTITGAVYPAIDLTAGQRERGTLEILVAAPVPRLGLLFAKYVSVVTVAVLTAAINLTMMVITLAFTGLAPQEFTLLLIVQLFGLLLLFAAFFSAVLLTVTSFARSFKEAQAYLIPLMVVSLAPGVIGMIPGLKLEGGLSVVPLLNIVLLGRDLFQGDADPAATAGVVLSTALYALAAIAAAARIFGAESVLYSEQTGWGDLFRRPSKPQPAATLVAGLLCLALTFPAMALLRGVFGRSVSIQVGVLLLPVLSVLVFGVLPLAAAAWRRVDVSSAFQCRGAAPVLLLAGAVLGICLWPLVLQAMHFVAAVTQVNIELFSELVGQAQEAREHALPWLVAGLVVTAIVEELFFRGYLFTALRTRLRPAATIVVSALLFGVVHLVLTVPISLERFLSSTLMGLVLGWICHASGSVVPGMILHGLYNAMLVLF